jgi:mRNA-degrading endonuclease YafQ of YafQ-DinJ toxin-antitoxin module
METFFTARFLRSFNKLPKAVQDDVEEAVEKFKQNQNHEALKLHKLHGRMKHYHAFSANFSYRLIIKIEKQSVYYMDVGDHSIYD